MVRMSDIIKKAKEREAGKITGKPPKPEETKAKKKEKPLSKPIRQQTPPQPPKKELPSKTKTPVPQKSEARFPKEEKTQPPDFRMSPVLMKKTRTASGEESTTLYDETAHLMEEILKKDLDYASVDTKRIISQVERIVDQLNLSNEKMILLAFLGGPKDKNYLPYHLVNVCIYSVEIGLALGYAKPKLIELGTAALLHGIGMIRYLDLINQPRRLSNKEYNEIKNYPNASSEILKKIDKDFSEIIIRTVNRHHERLDGSGYPAGLKENSINGYARIIGLIDAYEAKIHPRPYRREFTPVQALQKVLANKAGYDYQLIKILIEKIGIFPVGSFVELNTKEIAQVAKLNPGAPMRPVVKIVYEANRTELREIRMLDLTKHPTVNIMDCAKME